MAYFRCSLGGGGNGAVITVTYGADFYNQTLVATNGTDTVSVLASSSGTADITVPSEGSWVISCTIGADTYTSDPVSVELSYEATITAIPDGSTVLPTDDIETWLECAGITDKAYTTLAEVLADTDTYTTLLGDSNACDYMARSTTWADTEQVPVMTSNTTPSGTASAINQYSNDYAAWKAFDGNDSSAWLSSAGSSTSYSNLYVGYTFTEAKIIRSYYVKFKSEVTACTYKLQGSNDDTNWTDIGSTSTKLDGLNYVVNDTAYTSYRLFIVSQTTSSTSYNGGRVTTLQFYENADVTSDADAMRMLGKYDYACEALLANNTWASAIANSTYFESVLNVKVPTMTSNTAPYGEAGASSSSSGRPPYQAFNGKTYNASDGTTFWIGANAGQAAYVYYQFTQPVNVVKTKHATMAGSTGTPNMKWMYSDDGTTWSDATELAPVSYKTTRQVFTYDFPSCGAHRYWAYYIAGQWGASEVQFYGRAEAQTDIIHSAPSDTIYYMDNGSPVTLCTTDASGVGTVDWSDLPTGDITLYSSVAKDADNLSNDYSKTITVTKNKVEAYLMPDTALYWWGYMANDCQDCTSANGWTKDVSTYTLNTPTHNTNDVYLTSTAVSAGAIGTTHSVASGKTVKYIASCSYSTRMYRTTSSKNIYLSQSISEDNTTSLKTRSYTLTDTYPNVCIGIDSGSRNVTVNAFWLE